MGHAETHRKLHELVAAKQFDRMREYLRDDFSYEDTSRNLTTKTFPEFTDWLGEWFTAFSDARPEEGTYSEGPDFSVSVFHGRGTNDGPMGPFPATGRSMNLLFCEILHYDSDGRGISGEIFYDQLTLLTQLGLAQPPASAAAAGELGAVVRDMLAAFDRKDYETVKRAFARDAQGVDEIARRWLRSGEAIDQYFRQLEPVVSDVRSEVSDVHEVALGDTGLLTLWLEQNYPLEGQPQHISAPTTVALRREDGAWRIALFHSIPLPESA
jgi:uncharacterized protein (TIGR02246 family)